MTKTHNNAFSWSHTHDAELSARTLLPERQIILAGGPNFRDLGGLKGADGKVVVGNRFIRGDELGSLTDSDLDLLSRRPVKTVVDFRTLDETETFSDRLPDSVDTNLHLPIVPGNLDAAYGGGFKTPGTMENFMFNVYRHLPTDREITDTYRRFFELAQDASRLPLLYHCTAGKDRTGMASAAILLALGVDRETIIDDYLASNICLAKKYDRLARKYPEMVPGLFVRREYLETAFDAIDKKYGSVNDYLAGQLGIDIEAFRRRNLA